MDNMLEFKILKGLLETQDNLELLFQKKITSDYFTVSTQPLVGFLLKYYSKYREPLTREKFLLAIDSYPTTMKSSLLTLFETAWSTTVDMDFKFMLDSLHDQYKTRLFEEVVQNTSYFYKESDSAQGIRVLKEGLAKIEQLDTESYSSRPIGEDLGSIISQYEKVKSGIKERVVYTGFPTIDTCIGGYAIGDLQIVSGFSNVGKSCFALNVAHNVWMNNGNILYISAEMSEEKLRRRLVAMTANLPVNAIRDGLLQSPQEQLLKDTIELIKSKQNIFQIVDFAGCSTLNIRIEVEKFQKLVPIDLLVVDYISLIQPVRRFSLEHENDGQIALELRNIAKEYKFPCLAVAQNTKKSHLEKSNDISDIKSPQIARHADGIINLRVEDAETQEYSPVCILEAKITKSREGPKKEFKIQADFAFSRMRETL